MRTHWKSISTLLRSHLPFILILILFLVLRMFELEKRMPFEFDQVRYAWAMKDMVVDGRFPLLGAPAKVSGFQTGVLFYYLMYPFFVFSLMNPIALAYFALACSVLTVIALYLVARSLFSVRTGVFAALLYTVSFDALRADRIAWNPGLLPAVSVCMYYLLIRIASGNYRLIPVMMAVIGFAYHIHFTFVYFPVIATIVILVFLRSKKAVLYLIGSLPLFLLFFLPDILARILYESRNTDDILRYIGTYYHGFHLRRVIQLSYDAFIQMEIFLQFRALRILGPVLVFGFIVLEFAKRRSQSLPVVIVTLLFFLVPWLVMSVYSGEITDYYFFITRPIAVMILGYIANRMVTSAIPGFTVTALVFYVYTGYYGITTYYRTGITNYLKDKAKAIESIKMGKRMEYSEGDVKYFLYYYHSRQVGTR